MNVDRHRFYFLLRLIMILVINHLHEQLWSYQQFQNYRLHRVNFYHFTKLAARVLERVFTSEAVCGLCVTSFVVLILGWALAGRLNLFCALGFVFPKAPAILGCWIIRPRLFLPGLFAGWFVFPPAKLDLAGLSEISRTGSAVCGLLQTESSFCILTFLKKGNFRLLFHFLIFCFKKFHILSVIFPVTRLHFLTRSKDGDQYMTGQEEFTTYCCINVSRLGENEISRSFPRVQIWKFQNPELDHFNKTL